MLSLVLSESIPFNFTGAFAAPVSYGSELTNMPNKSYNQIFNDVPKTYWAFDYISEMNTRHVLSGYPNGCFYPDNYVTRGEFAKIMTLAAGMDITDPTYSNYADVSIDDWYCPYIEAARYYLSGYSNGETTFYLPEDNALREDIAVALVKLKGYSTTGFDLSILQTMFTDWQSISDGAQKYVATAVEKGLISGYEDGTFRGQDGVTRAETATLLWRAYQYGNGNKNFEQEDENRKNEENVEKNTKTEEKNNSNKNEETAKEKPKKEDVTPAKKQDYDYLIELSSSKLTVDSGDTAEITVTLTDESPDGVDFSQFKSDIPEENIKQNNEGNKNILTVSFDTSEAGKKVYTFSYKEKNKKFTLYTNELKKYTHKVETVASKVSFIHTIDYSNDSKTHKYNMVGAKNSVLYSDGKSIYEADENGSEEIFCVDDVEWQGSELRKQDKLSQKIVSYGYNPVDDDIYVIMQQYASETITLLYNITENEFVVIDNNAAYRAQMVGFYNNGALQTLSGRILKDGSFIEEQYPERLILNCTFIYNNTLYYHKPGVYGSALYKFNLSTNSFERIDTDTSINFYTAAYTTGCLYTVPNSEKLIKKMDTNGDSETVVEFESIRNDDEIPINQLSGLCVDAKENIYFYDDNYECIRKISKIS